MSKRKIFASPPNDPKKRKYDLSKYNINCIASSFKKYFRELSPPLVSFELLDFYVTNINSQADKSAIENIKPPLMAVLSSLPKENHFLLEKLCKFLKNLSKFSELTKMNSANLAVCFASNVFRTVDPIEQLKYQHLFLNAMKILIENADDYFAKSISEKELDTDILISKLYPDTSLTSSPHDKKPSQFFSVSSAFLAAAQKFSNLSSGNSNTNSILPANNIKPAANILAPNKTTIAKRSTPPTIVSSAAEGLISGVKNYSSSLFNPQTTSQSTAETSLGANYDKFQAARSAFLIIPNKVVIETDSSAFQQLQREKNKKKLPPIPTDPQSHLANEKKMD